MLLNLSRILSQIFLWIDLCICSLTKTGHCCIYKSKNGYTTNPESFNKNCKRIFNFGVDGIAPSSMTPGIVKEVRKMLDKEKKSLFR